MKGSSKKWSFGAKKKEGWNFKKAFPKLSNVIKKYKTIETTKELWYKALVLKEMEKVERIRYLSMLLIAGDLPYEFNYGVAPFIKEFLETTRKKEELSSFENELKELEETLKEVFDMGEEGVKASTRSHLVMKRAEKWTENYENKGKRLLEIIECMSDETLLN